MEKYIAFDVGGTKVKHGLLLEDGTILSKSSYPTVCNDLEVFLTNMVETINQYTSEHDIKGVAISLPGFIDTNSGYSERAGAIISLANKNLKKLLEERIPLRVEIENDGNCSALAEKWNGNAVESDDFICFTIGTGIGGGIMVNGQILHGHSFRGGEFGFMITRGGNKTNEIMHFNASTSSLIRSYKKYKGIAEEETVEGETIFSEASHDESVKGSIDEWLTSISYGIFNLAATLNPQKILIGGGVSSREGLIDSIIQHLEQIEWWKFLEVEIQACKHKNDAGMIGAVYHFKTKVNNKQR